VTNGAAVAAPRREAIEVGERVLATGGNAVDAAVGAAFALCVVEPYMTGLGGLGELVYLDPQRQAYVVDAAARAPLAAHERMYRVVGDAEGVYAWPAVEGSRNVVGPAAVTAPRLVAALEVAHGRFGRLEWRDVVEPAAALARDGWEVDYFTSAVVTHEMPTLARDPVAAALLYPGGVPLPPPIGNPPRRIRNEPLAEALAAVARDRAAAISGGEVAEDILVVAGAPRGVLTREDLEAAVAGVVDRVEPLVRFRGWAIYGSPLPSGAVTAAQTLAMLDRAGGAASDPGSPARYVRSAIASTVAFQHRLSRLTGDGGSEQVHEFVSEENLVAGADAVVAGSVPTRGAPALRDEPVTATTHVSVADADGGVVSLTHTLLSLFGAHVGVARGGFFLNNGMMWFDPRPGCVNSIAPGRRALSAMSPMIAVSPDGARAVAVGALGARRIIPAIAQVLENVIDYGMPLAAAVDWPRVHADSLATLVDERLPQQVVAKLADAGFAPARAPYGPTTLFFARASGVAADAATGAVEAAVDRRSAATWRFGA
jgi:gamma-glutamyltranspeptidase/glutathione hydrolase